MRLAGRILVVLAVSVGPAVVTSIGCGVTSEHFPGLPNEVPNQNGGSGSPAAGFGGSTAAATTTTGAGGSGGAGGAGAAQTLCDTAIALVESSTCGTCEMATAACTTDFANCSTCNLGSLCAAGCEDAGSSCIVGCLSSNAPYQMYIACVFMACAPECGLATPLACDLGLDGGDGGDGG